MTEEQFVIELEKLGIKVNELQLKQFNRYYELLVLWNEKMNLTGITEKNQVYLKHFYDSATICKVIDLENEETLCDIGTGAGFPGVVLKILFPKLKVTLVDSLNKRIIFLNEVIKELELNDIYTKHARAEEFACLNREKFDVVTARAVAPLSILLEYTIPLLKVGKNFISMKGNISQEIISASNALKLLDGEIKNVMEFELPYENSTRTLVVVRKNKITNKKFPRKFSDIKKKPL